MMVRSGTVIVGGQIDVQGAEVSMILLGIE